MKKSNLSVLLILLIGISTFVSCSSDGGSNTNQTENNSSSSENVVVNSSSSSVGSSGGISDFPTQLYCITENGRKQQYPYVGEDIVFILKVSNSEKKEYDTLTVGKIQNGQIEWNLPVIDNKYLKKFTSYYAVKVNDCCYGCNYDCDNSEPDIEIDVSYPNNLTSLGTEVMENKYIYIKTGGKNLNGIRIKKSEQETGLNGYSKGYAFFDYFSETGKVAGKVTVNYGFREKTFFNEMNLSKGWNIIYLKIDYDNEGEYERVYFSTDPKTIKGTLEWEETSCQ